MISSDFAWVIQSLFFGESDRFAKPASQEWKTMSRGVVGQKCDILQEFSPMIGTTLEHAIAIAMGVSGWNTTHYAFRFKNTETGEEIPFDAFPEINQV